MRGRKYTSQNREKYGTLERNQTAAERAAENKSEKNIRGMKMDGKNRENYNKNYIAYVNSFAPKTNHFKNCLRAFLVGGLICCIGQFFRYMLEIVFHLSGDELAGSVSVLLIFLGTLLTGLGVYDRIGRNAGAGSIVPITGFANAVVSAAIEFKPEGRVCGTGAKMFTIAGPVIVYGTLAAVVYGGVLWLLGG